MSLAGCPSPVSLPYFLTAVVTVLMASFLLGTAETVLPPAGHPVIVLVEGKPARNVSAVGSWMSTYSQRQHVAVGRWQADLNNPESSRGLYLVSAAGGTLNPLPKDYPNLSSQIITHIAHMDQDQSTDRSGKYLVYGNAADATTFASGMRALGFRSSIQGQVDLALVASHNPDIIKAYGGVMGALVALVMAAVFARTQRYGILRLHGQSWLYHASRETLHAMSVAAIGMGATALISVPILGFYNGLAQWMRWFRWSIQVWIPSIAVPLIVEIVTLAIAWSNAEILAQVKGRMTSLPVFSASYLLRFPVAMLVILLIISVTLAARELWCYEDQQDQWTTVDRHGGGSHSVASARLSSTPPARSVWLTQSAHGWVT